MSRQHGADVGVVPARPKLAGDVRVHAPRSDDAPWIIERDGRRYFRVSGQVAELADILTGAYDHDELVGLLGPPWDRDALHTALTRFQSMELLDDGEEGKFSSRRFAVVPPMSVQFTVLDPSGLLARIAPLLRGVASRPGMVLCWTLAVGGLVALALAAGEVRDILGSPLPALPLVLLIVGGFLGTVIHEFAHGAVLVRYGGQPRRMGMMLFYLLPAFFCDVSDGWLLSRRSQRVRVALAGIFAQFVCAGTVGVVGTLLPSSEVRDGLLLLSAATYLAGVINLVPFVKLDGYLALMAAVDVPNLRTLAIEDARNCLGHRLFGARRERHLTQRWAVPYGLACMAFPLYLIGGVAFAAWSGIVEGFGFIGAMLTATFAFFLAWAALRGTLRILREALSNGARVIRLVLVTAVTMGTLAIALATIPVDEEIGGYYQSDGEQLHLFVPATAGGARPEGGDEVELRSNGTLLRPLVGRSEVVASESMATTLGLEQVNPVGGFGGDIELDFHRYELVDTEVEPEDGRARVQVGERSLGGWIYGRYIAPVMGF